MGKGHKTIRYSPKGESLLHLVVLGCWLLFSGSAPFELPGQTYHWSGIELNEEAVMPPAAMSHLLSGSSGDVPGMRVSLSEEICRALTVATDQSFNARRVTGLPLLMLRLSFSETTRSHI